MKITVQINNESVEITLTQEQLAQIEAQKKIKKFEWHYNGPFYLSTNGISNSEGSHQSSIEHGRYRKTKKAAENSLLRNKRANRIEALAEQLDGLKDFVKGEDNYFIYSYEKDWEAFNHTSIFDPEKVYMTYECAIEICRMLNEGEFSLDEEIE